MNNLSKLTLGTAQLGLDYGIANSEGKPKIEKAFSILAEAVENGIRSFDTACAYGDSENVLGKYFAENRNIAKESVITTKIVLGKNGGYKKREIEKAVFSRIHTSLERLKLDSVDNLMLHHCSDLKEYKEDVVSALEKARDEGLVKKIGVSIYNASDIEELLKYEVFKCVQLPLNIIDLRLTNSGVLNKLKKYGVTVYARSVFLQGLFFMPSSKLPKQLKGAEKYIKVLNNLCYELGISIAELALGYVRDIDEVDSIVVGAETPEQIKENVNLINSPSIPKKYMKQIKEYFADVPDFYLEPWRWENKEK